MNETQEAMKQKWSHYSVFVLAVLILLASFVLAVLLIFQQAQGETTIKIGNFQIATSIGAVASLAIGCLTIFLLWDRKILNGRFHTLPDENAERRLGEAQATLLAVTADELRFLVQQADTLAQEIHRESEFKKYHLIRAEAITLLVQDLQRLGSRLWLKEAARAYGGRLAEVLNVLSVTTGSLEAKLRHVRTQVELLKSAGEAEFREMFFDAAGSIQKASEALQTALTGVTTELKDEKDKK